MNRMLRKNRILGALGALILLAAFVGLSDLRGAESPVGESTFSGIKAGTETNLAGIRLCWCPSGKFIMGSPLNEPERRPDEDQVPVTLTKGFWMAKFETTQGQWTKIMGKLPSAATAELPDGNELPVGNVNFAEA